MRPGDLTTGATRLTLAWKTLMAHWDQTRPEWNDSVSREFEEQYLAALEPQITATLERMRALAGMLGAAQHECER